MGRLNPEKKSEIFNSNSKTRFRMYKAGKRWLVAGTATLAGLFGASIAQGSSVKADTSAGVAKEASQETLATAKTGTIPAASTTASTSASQSTSTSLSQSTSAVASASAASSLSQSTSAVASASAQASTSLSQSNSAAASTSLSQSTSAASSLSQSTSAANSAQASQSANTDQQANSHVAIQLFAASAPSTAVSSTVANSQATTSTVVASTTSASTTNSEGSLASNQVAATMAFDADTLKAVLAQLPTGTTAEVLNGVTVFTLPVDTTAAVIKQAQDTIIAAKPAGPVQVKAMAATATTTLTASEQIAHDVMHDAVGTLTTQTTFGLLNSFSQIADLINMYDPTTKTFKFDAAAMATLQNDKLISGNGGEDTTGLFGQTNHWDIPPINTTSQVWLDPNGKFYSSDQKDWLGRPTGYRTLLTAQQVQDLWNVGVASFLQPYVQGLIDYQQQIANALDPTKTPDAAKNQAALMAMSDYRAGDMTSDGSNFASIISGVLGGSTVDQLVPAVFGNNNLVTGGAATAFNNTWSGLNKLLKVIISTIQNSIVHQALGDIRSLGLADGYMTNGLSNYVPASLQGAINQNNTLRTIVNTIGMGSATTASYTNSVYQALANGITSAVLRNANYGIETALAAMDITPVNQLKADGDTIYTPTQMGQLATFNPTDPTSAMGHNQTAANWSLLMQSAGYSWMNKIAAPLAQLAMSDVVGDGAGHSTIETSTAAILKTLVANGTIKQSDADLINNSLGTTADSWAKNADMANYQRPGQGASDFILGLYNAEVKAYQTAATDYIKAPNATTLNTPIFINPGDPNAIGKGTATASNSVNYQILAYNKVYKWLQDSDAAFKASEAADTAANTQIKTVAKGSAISITPADSMPNTITGGTSLFGAAGLDATKADFKPLTDPSSVLGKNGVNWLNNQLTAAYIASYNSEATRATDAFAAGQQAAKDAATAANGYAIPDPAKRDNVPSSTNYSVSDDTTAQVTSMKGGTISHTTGDIYYAGYQNQATTFRVNYTVAKGTSKQLLATDFPTSAGYIAYTDANGNPAFYKLFNTAIGTNVVEDPVSSNGLTAGDSQSLVATNVDSSNVINFVYSNNLVSQGAVLNGQPITTPYDGQTASSHASGKLSVTLNFKDSQTGSAANYGPYDLVEGDYVVTGDSSKVGKYTVTLTDQGRQKIEAALTAAGASVQNVDDQLKGLTGTITIQDSVTGLSQVTSANQTINVGDAVPSQSAFFPTILDSKGNSISIDDVTISGLPTGSPQAGMYIVTLTVTDPISGQVTTKQAILNVLDPINSQLNSQIQASTSAAASVAASEAASTAASMSTALSQANSTASAANSATSDANSTASTANSAASELASQASARESASTSAMMSEHNSQYISEQTSADMSNFISQEISNATSAGTSAAVSDGYNASDASNAGSAVGSQVGSVADSLISSQSTSISESARESNIGSIAASQAASDGISDESSLTSIYNSAANSAQSQYNSVIESNSASTQLSNSISQSNSAAASAVVSQASAANSALSQLSEIASRSDSAVASASSQASAANSVASAASELQSATSASNSAAVSEAISNAESQASAAGSTSEQISAAGSTAASEKTSEIASNASSTAASQTASQAGSVAESQAVSAGSTDSQASAAGSVPHHKLLLSQQVN
ncbi:KxYKxGKxW signal peptide domain-containing protein [Lacticaseibacillus saniviri]